MKTKLFIDFDCTIVDAIKAYCNVYNIIFKDHPDFKPADHTKVYQWDFGSECELAKYRVDELFASPLFFENLEFMPNAYKVIEELSKKYEIYICTLGTLKNLALKAQWLEKNLPIVKNHILLHVDSGVQAKDVINMEDSIIIDDTASVLRSVNADLKICFGKEYEWNKDWNGRLRCENWLEVDYIL